MNGSVAIITAIVDKESLNLHDQMLEESSYCYWNEIYQIKI